MATNHFSNIMKEEATKVAGKTKKEPSVLPTKDQHIKELEDRRKDMRKKEDRSETKKVEYRELKQTVKDKYHERKEQIMLKLYFKVVKDQNRYIQRRIKDKGM